jgi:glucuronoarabinoxylan endo-1,4-beta-xylanase
VVSPRRRRFLRRRALLSLAQSLALALALAAAAGCGGGSADPTDAAMVPINVTVTVDPTTSYQTMVGFGAAVAYYDGSAMANPMSAQLFQTLFGDLGIQVLRVGNWYQNNNDNDGAFNQTAAFVQAVHQAGFSPLLLMSSWNPPLSLKSNGDLRNGGTLPQDSSGAFDYADFATWWAQSLTAFAAATGGIVPDYVSIQNEPDYTTNNEGTCLFDPTEGTNAGYGQALAAVKAAVTTAAGQPTGGFPMPKFIGPENDSLGKNEFEKYMTGLSSPTNFLDDLDAVAHHLYGSGTDSIPNSFNYNMMGVTQTAASKPIWQSEYAPAKQSFYDTAWLIQNAVSIEGVSTYLYWDLYWPMSTGLVSTTSTGYVINDDYYAVQHFAKGIGVGWTRVAATASDPSLLVSAFLSPDATKLTLVLLNIGVRDDQVTVDPGTFVGATSNVYRSSGTSERFAALGPLDATGSFLMPSGIIGSVGTVMLSP